MFPSGYETFSLVTFEAAASGLPVLATPVGGISELIRDGKNGFLITRQPEVIADRLRTLNADPRRRARMGEAARRSALPFTWSEMVARHEQLYTRLARPPAPCGADAAATVDAPLPGAGHSSS